jgi:hypothetical protein
VPRVPPGVKLLWLSPWLTPALVDTFSGFLCIVFKRVAESYGARVHQQTQHGALGGSVCREVNSHTIMSMSS